MSKLSDFVSRQGFAAPPETGVSVTRFGSPVKALSKSLLQPGQAVDSENVTVEDGALGLRDGFRNVIAPPAGQTTQKGFKWLRTIVGSVLYEAFLSVDNVGGTVTPNEIAYDGTNDRYSRTPITAPGPTALDVSDTYWRFASFRDQVFGWNYSSAESADDPGPLVTYTLSDYDSWVAVRRPTDPTAGITVTYAKNSAGGAAYSQIRWTGGDPLNPATDVAYTAPAAADPGAVGGADVSSVSGEAFQICHTASTLGRAKVKIDLSAISAGAQDLQRADAFGFTLTLPNVNFQIDATSVKLYFETTGGTETELKVETDSSQDSTGKVVRIECYAKFGDKTRATWASVRYVSLEYDVSLSSATASENMLRFNPVTKGGIADWTGDAPITGIMVAYTWANSTNGYESGLGTFGYQLSIQALKGDKYAGHASWYLGSYPVLGTATSAESGVDKVRVYMAFATEGTLLVPRKFGKWRRLTEQADTDTTYDLSTTWEEFQDLTEYEPNKFVHDDILCAAQFKGWMVWGYRDGSVRHSRYGKPLLQASSDDAFAVDIDDEDPLRGATFQLNDDTPRGFVQIGDTLVVLGAKRVYVQTDTTGLPAGMTPPSIVQGAPGCIGFESFDAWKLDTGVPGCAYVSTDGASVWFIAIVQSTGSERGPKALDVTVKVRGWLHEKLYGGSTLTDPESVQLIVDQETDALVLFYSQRALILRRPGLDSESRDWDVCDFEPGHHGSTWGKLAYAAGYGIFGVRLNGALDQFFRANVLDTATGGRTTVDCDLSAYSPTLTDTGTGFVPSATDTGAETVTFAAVKNWVNGLPANVSANGGGLFAATDYFLHRVNSTTFSFHTTADDALTGANAVNLTAGIVATVTPRDHVMFGDFTTAGTNPGWSTGLPATYDRTEGGLVKGQTVYMRRISKSAYSVHPTVADADAGTNPVSLTATLTGRFRPLGRDDGTAVTGFWESGEFVGPNRRVLAVEVHRSGRGDSPSVQARTGDAVYVSEVDPAERLVMFEKDPGFEDTVAAAVTAGFGQFDADAQYFLHRRTDVGFSVHTSERDALRDAGRVACTVAGGYFVPGSAPVVLASGDRFARFGPRVTGSGIGYRVTLPEGCGPVRALQSREVVVGQMEHR